MGVWIVLSGGCAAKVSWHLGSHVVLLCKFHRVTFIKPLKMHLSDAAFFRTDGGTRAHTRNCPAMLTTRSAKGFPARSPPRREQDLGSVASATSIRDHFRDELGSHATRNLSDLAADVSGRPFSHSGPNGSSVLVTSLCNPERRRPCIWEVNDCWLYDFPTCMDGILEQ